MNEPLLFPGQDPLNRIATLLAEVTTLKTESRLLSEALATATNQRDSLSKLSFKTAEDLTGQRDDLVAACKAALLSPRFEIMRIDMSFGNTEYLCPACLQRSKILTDIGHKEWCPIRLMVEAVTATEQT